MRAPDLSGVARGWRIDLVSANRQSGKPDTSATLAQWLVNGPFHPLWSYWIVACIHLRPIDGVPQAKVSVPGATHEFLIISLESAPGSPEHRPDPDDLSTWHILQPADCVHQEIGLTDQQAADICDLIVRAACEKGWTLDSDARSFWQDTIARTAEHFRLGGHPEAVA